jgi:Tfp pilus assembly protein PilF
MDFALTLPYLADLLNQLGRGQEAVDVRRRAIGLYETLKAEFADDPRHRRNLVGSYLELANLLHRLGRHSEASEPYRKALALEEDDAGVNNDLAWFLATSPEPGVRDTARALRLAQKAVAARPDTYNFRNTLGVAYYRNGNDREAVTELEKATSMMGGTPFDWFFLAMAHWRMGHRDLARTFFNRSVEWMTSRNSQDVELRRMRAEAETMLAGEGGRSTEASSAARSE